MNSAQAVAITAAGISMGFGNEADLIDESLAQVIHTAYPRLESTRAFVDAVDAVVAQTKDHAEKAAPYTFAGELTRERSAGGLTDAEQGVAASRWGS